MTDFLNALAIAPGYIIVGLSLFLTLVIVLLILTGLHVTRVEKPEAKGKAAKLNERGKP